jgi:hypothetical protein
MTIRNPLRLALGTLAAATTIALAAHAWQQEVPFSTTVHDHEFSRLSVEQVGKSCTLRFKLWFDAPEASYQYPDPKRNYTRFHARVMMSEGRKIFSPIFGNGAAGKRTYHWDVDTTNADCWGGRPQKLYAVDVEGCRNRGCEPEPFQ